MKDRINVWFKSDRGTRPVIIEIDNTLEALQNLVGGYIETLTVFEGAVLIFNEEGRLRGLPYNITFCGVDLVGPLVLAGVDGDEFTDIPEAAVEAISFGVMASGREAEK